MNKEQKRNRTTGADIQQDKLIIENEDMTVTITPPTHGTELFTKAAYNVKQTGFPTNQDLDSFGDQIIEILEKSKEHAKDGRALRIINSAQGTVESMQKGILERNHDELIQKIVKSIMNQSQGYSETQRNLSMKNKEMRQMNKDSKRINQKIVAVIPLIAQMAMTIVKDKTFRDLLLSLMEIFSNTFSRVNSAVDGPNITNALKDDIRNNGEFSVRNTRAAIQNVVKGVTVNAKLNEEEKDELIAKAIKVLGKIKTSEHYRNLLFQIFVISDDIIELWQNFRSHPELKTRYNESTTIINDVKLLIERTSGRSLRKWVRYLEKIIAVKDDHVFKLIRRDVEDLVFDTEHRYNSQKKFKTMFEKIRLEGQDLDKSYRGLFLKFFTETKDIFMGMANDPIINGIRENINNLIQEIFIDEAGNPSLKVMSGSFSRIRDCFFPIIKHRLTHLDLPGVKIVTPKFAFSLSDVRLNLGNFIPENFHLESDNNLTFDVRNLKRKGDINFRLHVGPFPIKLKKVRFYVKKKTGMKFKDYGVMSIKLKAGIMVGFHVRLNKNKVDFVECSKVKTNLDGLKIKIHKAHHKTLDKTAIGLLPAAKPQIEKQISKKLKDILNSQLCDRVNDGLEDYERKRHDHGHRHKRSKSEKRLNRQKKAKRSKRVIDIEKLKVPEVEKKELEKRKKNSHLRRQFAKLDSTGAKLSSSISDSETGLKGDIDAEVYERHGRPLSRSHQPNLVAEQEYYEYDSDYENQGFKGELKHKQKEIVGVGAEVVEGHGKSHHHHHHPKLVAEQKYDSDYEKPEFKGELGVGELDEDHGKSHRHHHHPKSDSKQDYVAIEQGGNLGMTESPQMSHHPNTQDYVAIEQGGNLGMKESPQMSHHHSSQMLPYEDELAKDEGYRMSQLPKSEKLKEESVKKHKEVGVKGSVKDSGYDKHDTKKESFRKTPPKEVLKSKDTGYDKHDKKKESFRKTPPKEVLKSKGEEKGTEKKRKLTRADLEKESGKPKLVADKSAEDSGKEEKPTHPEQKFKDELVQKKKEMTIQGNTKGEKLAY